MITANTKIEVEFAARPGKRYILATMDDAGLERLARRLKLWTPGSFFPTFTYYLNGEEAGGGGDL
jgi:hypothetical protein